VIVIEDLNVAGMVRNRSLAKAISDCGWGEFRRMTEYKAVRAGRHLIVIDRWYPSSKTCSACGHLLAALRLSTRTWQCPSCGTRHDRDINAAKNILAAGLAVSACGADVRHPGSPRMAVSLTQAMLNEKPPDDGHRKNILSSSFTHIGIAVFRDSSGTVWLTQDFSN